MPSTGLGPIRLFLSYRRDDSPFFVGHLTAELNQEFGEDNIFRDIDSIVGGADYEHAIFDAIQQVDMVLSLIGSQWISGLPVANDWVYRELVAAFAADKRVVPVLIGNTAPPAAHDLPPELRELAKLQCIPLRSDPDFAADIKRLLRSIRTGLGRAERPQATPSPTAEIDALLERYRIIDDENLAQCQEWMTSCTGVLRGSLGGNHPTAIAAEEAAQRHVNPRTAYRSSTPNNRRRSLDSMKALLAGAAAEIAMNRERNDLS